MKKKINDSVKKEMAEVLKLLPDFAKNIKLQPSSGEIHFQIPLDFRMGEKYISFLKDLEKKLKKFGYCELGGGCAMQQTGTPMYDEEIGPKDIEKWAKKHGVEVPDWLK